MKVTRLTKRLTWIEPASIFKFSGCDDFFIEGNVRIGTRYLQPLSYMGIDAFDRWYNWPVCDLRTLVASLIRLRDLILTSYGGQADKCICL